MASEQGETGDSAETAPTVKEAVKSQFSPVAANYAASTVHAQGDELRAMVELAALTGSESVLDAGCGPGHTALTFAPHARRVTGVDLSSAMLEQGRRLAAERHVTNVDFREGDVESLPFADGAFDLVVSRYSAHHWPAPQKALAEFRRVLRPDGKDGERRRMLLLADVVSFDDHTTDTHFQAIELLRDPSHVRDHTEAQWLAMLDAAGFEASVEYRWRLHLNFGSWVARMQTPAESVAMIRTIMASAPGHVRDSLAVEAGGSFTMRCAVFRAVPGADG